MGGRRSGKREGGVGGARSVTRTAATAQFFNEEVAVVARAEPLKQLSVWGKLIPAAQSPKGRGGVATSIQTKCHRGFQEVLQSLSSPRAKGSSRSACSHFSCWAAPKVTH